MKRMKKIMAVVVAVMMTLAMAVTAFASGTETTYKITAPATDHTYEIYQIFTGEYSGGKLNDVQWGKNGTTKSGVVDSSVLQEIQNAKNESEILTTVKKYVDLNSSPVGTVTNESAYDAVPGYYLIKDKDNSVSGQDAYTLYLVQVVNENVTVRPKTGIPTVEKKVKDTNDSVDDSTSGWQDSADYDIGDTIPYQLTATMGDLSHYNHYYVEFVDQMTHLTYTGITSVKVGDSGLSEEQYSVQWDEDDKILNVTILDVKAYGASTGTKVVVEYTATLDSDAAIGSTGNPNDVYLKFTNNPNNTGDGTTKPSDTGETPKDKNIVFTYKVTANKVTTDKNPLKGAAFELFKKNTENEYVSLGIVGAEKDGAQYIVDENTTTFSWNGIDDGEYKLVEVVTPTGFNPIDPIEFTVAASHDETEDDPKLNTLTGGDLFTGEVATGELSADIVNRTGTELPSTGGIGTTIFYVIGAILVLGAGILLITKRRVNAHK